LPNNVLNEKPIIYSLPPALLSNKVALGCGKIKDKEYIPPQVPLPILLYHRFGPEASDSMTIRTAFFESHLKYLDENSYKVVSLRRFVDRPINGGLPHSPRPVVITVDDGHKSVYTDMLPLIKKYRVPVTLFLYPSAISNAAYAMTWDQLREMRETGLFDFQSHTYWHPNFKKDRERLRPAEYEQSVEMQLKKSKARLEKEFNMKVEMLAWPFGIWDEWLMGKAAEAGYRATFTMERHHAAASDCMMALPRYLITNGDRGKAFERILGGKDR
jgi:peptidoglycan/xylan/chitin deacetylase (PgdA/CDA1 family)